jgi:3-keto-5-aminohexanoate cleavage enzyme
MAQMQGTGQATPDRRTIVMVAPTGSRYQKADHPMIPLSPREIAEDVAACVAAGASVAHLHARGPDGRSTQSPEVYREIIERIRERTDVVIQLSIGAKGFTVDEALQPLVLEPEMASLPMRNVAAQPEEVYRMAAAMRGKGVVPSVDGSSAAMFEAVGTMQREGVFADPLCLGFILGEPDSLDEATARLQSFRAAAPAGAMWWCAKGGAHAAPVAALAVRMGGHLRAGLEDVVPAAGMPVVGNVALVERSVAIARAEGSTIATAAEVRALFAAARG